MAEAKVISDRLESVLRDLNLSALDSYLEAKEDLLAIHQLRLSRQLKKVFSTTNPIESLNSLIEEDMRRVKKWKDSEHFVLPETSFTFHSGDIVYTFPIKEEFQWVGRSVVRWMKSLNSLQDILRVRRWPRSAGNSV
jgi:transposase-like protein